MDLTAQAGLTLVAETLMALGTEALVSSELRVRRRQRGHTEFDKLQAIVLLLAAGGECIEDVRKLLEVLHALVEQGNTVLVIEHNLEVIKTADWVIDMGPEGGDGGGMVVAEGTPEQIAKSAASHTGRFLREVLARRPAP